MKNLPDLYTNSFTEKIDNSQEFTMVTNEIVTEKVEYNNIKEKINNIFKSKNYIYKIDVEIKLDTETIYETLIGRTKNHVITIQNKLIPINNIIDIKEKNSN